MRVYVLKKTKGIVWSEGIALKYTDHTMSEETCISICGSICICIPLYVYIWEYGPNDKYIQYNGSAKDGQNAQ